MVSRWVVNASPIILLSKIQRIDLFLTLGLPISIPFGVAEEIGRGLDDPAMLLFALQFGEMEDPGPIPEAVRSFHLGSGESDVLALALVKRDAGVVLDDRAARNAAKKLAIPQIGTLGLILSAKKRGAVTAARPLLDQLRQHGMYLSDKVLNQSLDLVGE